MLKTGLALGMSVVVLAAAACSNSSGNGRSNNNQPKVCSAGCPSGFTCTGGVCTGGNPTELVFDLHTVSLAGTLTLDGAPLMMDAGCSGWLISLHFAGASGAAFNADLPCSSIGAWSTRIAPG